MSGPSPASNHAGIIHRWREWLPVSEETPIVTLHEGNTPLIPAPQIGRRVGQDRTVYLKFEGANPTGSFKDRGMTLAISKAVEDGTRGVICASTGNTSASAAAYAGRAGIPCWVVLPQGKVAVGKLAQALAHGATVIPIDGNFDEALGLVRHVTEERALTLVNSLNPFRIEGQKTIAFEVVDQLGGAPHAHCLPVGNAGNITATWRGYSELHARGAIAERPRMLGFQAAGAAPIVRGCPIEKPETVASAIRIGNPASWKPAVAAASDSQGLIEAVTDEEILDAYRLLASEEGVFCEPASAASVAGLIKLSESGGLAVPEGGTVVCTLTGHGLKDPDRAIEGHAIESAIPAQLEALIERMGIE